MTSTTLPRLSAHEVHTLRLIGTYAPWPFTPRNPDELADIHRLFDLGFLIICPPGHRYKWSPVGYALAPLYGIKREANHVNG